MTDATQERVFAFLSDPATHGGEAVKRIDTHAASVFLAGGRAWKVKRAVRFPFLDYSTLEKRKSACETELRVNRAYAPAIYLGVVPITEEPGGSLALGGEGNRIEWAVEMRRFDETQTLDHVADRGALDRALAERLASVVADAHAAAPVVREQPWIESFEAIMAQNAQELAQYPDVFAPARAVALAADTRGAFDRLRPLMDERRPRGMVRRCHGDLHLGNIVLIGETPMLFDAIEFSDAIATIDLFYDLAFLLMDLIDRGLDAAANVVLNRYLLATGRSEDLDALALLPLFMAVRAAIRAKVTAARIADSPGGARDLTTTAQNYFGLAQRLVAPPPAMLIAVGGLSGTGKSVLARSLAPVVRPLPGAVVLRSDVERKMLFGVPETSRLASAAYTQEVNRQVYESLARKAARVLAAGHSAIVDAVFARASERAEMRAVAADAGAGFAGLFLDLDLAARKARLDARSGDASDAVAATADLQEQYDLGPMDWIMVDASGMPSETLARACEALKTR